MPPAPLHVKPFVRHTPGNFLHSESSVSDLSYPEHHLPGVPDGLVVEYSGILTYIVLAGAW